MSGNTVTLTDNNFDSFIEGNPLVLVDCWAQWCKPCHMLTPILDELADEMAGKAAIGKLNVDENPGISYRFNISAIPTMLVFKNGVMQEPLVGVRPKEDIKKYLQSKM